MEEDDSSPVIVIKKRTKPRGSTSSLRSNNSTPVGTPAKSAANVDVEAEAEEESAVKMRERKGSRQSLQAAKGTPKSKLSIGGSPLARTPTDSNASTRRLMRPSSLSGLPMSPAM